MPRGKSVKKEWMVLEFNGQLTAAVPFQELSIAADAPGGAGQNSCRLLRMLFSVNYAHSTSFTYTAPAPLPFFWVGVYNTNTQALVNTVNVVPTIAGVDEDKSWMFRRAWPIPIEPDPTGGGATPLAGGAPWVGGEMWCDWQLHGGAGTSELEHDRDVRLVVGVGPATPTGGSSLGFTVNGLMLCALP